MAAGARGICRHRRNPRSATGQHGGYSHGDHHRGEEVVGRTFGDQPFRDRGRQRCRYRGSGTVRRGDSEGERAAGGHECGGDGAADKGRGDAVSEPGVERRREDERREGESVGDRDDAGGQAGEQVTRSGKDLSGSRGAAGPGLTLDGHATLSPRGVGVADAVPEKAPIHTTRQYRANSPATDREEICQFSNARTRVYSAACWDLACAPSFFSRSMAASAIGVPGPKMALAPASYKAG